MYTGQVRGWGVVRVYVYRPSEGWGGVRAYVYRPSEGVG